MPSHRRALTHDEVYPAEDVVDLTEPVKVAPVSPNGHRAPIYQAEAADLRAGVRNGKWLDGQVFPPLRYHLPGIVPEGSTLLVGPPKIGKSWFVLALGLGVAYGGRMLGIKVEPRPVFYLALEDGHRRLQDRCRTLLEAGVALPEPFEYLTVVDPEVVLTTITAWLGRHHGTEPLVILDTLGKVMPPARVGESTYQRDYRIGTDLKRMIDSHPGAGLVTNHHDRKAAAGFRGEGVRLQRAGWRSRHDHRAVPPPAGTHRPLAGDRQRHRRR